MLTRFRSPQDTRSWEKTLMYDETETIDIDSVPLEGGYLVKLLALSIDPFMRMRMRDPSQWSYTVRFFFFDTKLAAS